MKPLYCISNALKNILYKRKYAFRLMAGIVFINAVLQSSFLILRVIQNYYDDVLYKNLTDNAVSYSSVVSDNAEISDKDADMFKNLSMIENTVSPVCRILPDIMGYISDKEHRFIKFSRTVMSVDNKKYDGTDEKSRENSSINSISSGFAVDLYLSEYDSMDINTQKQFEHNNPDENLFLYGGPAENSGEILISSRIFSIYNIENPGSVVGKNVSFFIDDHEYIKNAKIAGILNGNYFNMPSTFYKSDIIIFDSIKNVRNYCAGGENVDFYLPINNLLNNTDVYNDVQQFNTENNIYCSEELLKGLSYTEKLSDVSEKILSVICAFLLFAMILSVFSIVKTNINSSKKYYGMLAAIGMNRGSLFAEFIFEQIFIIIASLLISFPVYEIFVLIINKVITVMINDKIQISMSQLLNIYALSSGLGFILICIISCIGFLQSVPKNIMDSLK